MITTVNLKRNRAESNGQSGGTVLVDGPATPDNEREEYYWGLRVDLEEPELQKLGLTDPPVGETRKIEGLVKIIMYAEDDESGRRATLQIQELGIDNGEEEEKTLSGALYSGGDKE